MMNAGEHVEERPIGRRGEADATGCERRHAKRRCQINQALVVGFFITPEMALQLDVHRITAEDPDRSVEQSSYAVAMALERRAADEGHQPTRRSLQLVESERALALGRAKLHARDQAAEIAIAFLAFAEHGQRKRLERRDRWLPASFHWRWGPTPSANWR